MKSLKDITFIFAAFTVLIFAACSTDVNNNSSTSDKILESVKITTAATKTEYFTGETLDTTGLELTACYSDNSSKKVTGWSASGFNSKNAHAAQKITVSYTENNVTKSDTYTIKINSIELVSISVTAPSKTEYITNDAADRTGMVVTAKYNNGTTEEITSYTDDFDSQLKSTGVKTVTVYYGSKTAVFEISVSPSWLDSISVTAPEKTEYFQCEDFDAAGMVVTALKSDGTSAEVTDYTTDFAEKVQLTGEQTVTVTYEEKTAGFTIKVKALEVTELYIARKPSKLDYIEDEKIDLTGLVVRAKFNNNSVKTITEYTSDMEEQLQSAGSKTITITYGGKTASFVVNVAAKVLQKITLSGDYKTQYYEKEEFDPVNLTITAYYDNGKTYEISQSGDNSDSSTGWIYSGLDTTTEGDQTITVTYSGKTAEFTANVSFTDSIVLDTTNAKTTYYFNDEFDSTGLKVKLHYKNDHEVVLADTEYTTDFNTLNTTLGDKTVTVNYDINSKTYTQTYAVKVIADKLEITSEPDQTTYFLDSSFASAGLVVTAYNKNNDDLVITDYTTDFDEQVKTTGTKNVTVTCYGNLTDTFEITVLQHAPEPAYQFHKTVTPLDPGTDGTAGTTGDYAVYAYFGDMPCSEKASDILVDTSLYVTHGGFTYYYGYDGNYYAKYNGTYYKVEPCKWRILSTDTENSTVLLFPESVYMYSKYEEGTTCEGLETFKKDAFTTSAAALIKNMSIFYKSDLINTDYGFNSNIGTSDSSKSTSEAKRSRESTSYAVAFFNDNHGVSYSKIGYWTRDWESNTKVLYKGYYYINAEGTGSNYLCYYIGTTICGVCPAITVTYSKE